MLAYNVRCVASVSVRNARMRGAFVLDIIAAFAAHQVNGQALCSMVGGGVYMSL